METNKTITKKNMILRLLRTASYTICELNRIVNTADSRKRISDLKREGHNVQSTIVNKSNGTKRYWINE